MPRCAAGANAPTRAAHRSSTNKLRMDRAAEPAARRAATGLVLSGGGARAAYQVGVLKALAQIRRDCQAPAASPFPVIAGTSAGAINAAALACGADDFAV